MAIARREALKARRAVVRMRAARVGQDVADHLTREYKRARKELRKVILRSKDSKWKGLCEEVERDPWGRPYKIVRKKIGVKQPGPKAMDPEGIAAVVEHLFPDSRLDEPVAGDFSGKNDTAPLIPLVMPEEVEAAAKRLLSHWSR